MKASSAKKMLSEYHDDDDLFIIIWDKTTAEVNAHFDETGQTLEDFEWQQIIETADQKGDIYDEAINQFFDYVREIKPLDQGCSSCNTDKASKCRCDAK